MIKVMSSNNKQEHTMTTTTSNWYRIGGTNQQAEYGYGTEEAARAYCAEINKNRDINHVQYELCSPELTLALDTVRNDGFDFSDCAI